MDDRVYQYFKTDQPFVGTKEEIEVMRATLSGEEVEPLEEDVCTPFRHGHRYWPAGKEVLRDSEGTVVAMAVP